MQLGRIEAIEADVATLDARIGERLLPYDAEMALLMTIPGVNWLVAAVVIAEIGTDMSVFLSVHCPADSCPWCAPRKWRRRPGSCADGRCPCGRARSSVCPRPRSFRGKRRPRRQGGGH